MIKNRLSPYLFAFFLGLILSAPAYAATYQLDHDHTAVEFKVRHLLSWVRGTFNEFEGSFTYDPEKPETWAVNATIQATSIDTNVEPRDNHLRSGDFFDVEKFPTLTFQSTQVMEATASSAKIQGELTIRDVTKSVTLDLEIHGIAKDPWGNTLAGFTATTKINRTDFGLNWNEALETGGVLVGEEVRITIEVEGILQD